MLPDDYVLLLRFIAYVATLFVGARICQALGVPSMLGEIVAGMLMGPFIGKVVPVFSNGSWSSAQMLGQIGVGLLLFESGAQMDFDCIKEVGARSLLIALTGMALPIALSLLVLSVFWDFDVFPNALSAGCALAPTSVGVAVALLSERDQIKSRLGQTIISAAALDDVLSLVILIVLVNLEENASAGAVVGILLGGIAFLVVGIGAIGMWLLPKVPSRSLSPQVTVSVMVLTLVGVSTIGAVLGSPLLGAFVAGTWFVGRDEAKEHWGGSVGMYTPFLVRFFFGAVIAFAIPVDQLFKGSAVGQGIVLGLLAAIVGKLLVGVLATHLPKKERLALGAAMVGRGELGFLIAEMAYRSELISEDLLAVTTWALFCAVFSSPLLFLFAIKLGDHPDPEQDREVFDDGVGDVSWNGTGQQQELRDMSTATSFSKRTSSALQQT